MSLALVRTAVIGNGGDRALREILGALEGEYRLTWFQRVYKTQELRDNISACTAKLDIFIERFTVSTERPPTSAPPTPVTTV